MKSPHLKFALFILLVVSAACTAKMVGLEKITHWLADFCHYVQGMGITGILLFAVVFGVASLLALPAMPFTVGAGVVFGFAGGLATSMLGIAIGGALGFLVSRYLARDEVALKLKSHPKFQAIDTAIGSEGWKIVGLLRMCPFPFGLSNYLYGLTSVSFWQYMIATVVGVLPGVSFFVYLGAAGKAGLNSTGKISDQLLPLGIGLVAGVVALVYVGRVARAAVAKATIHGPTVQPGDLTKVPGTFSDEI